MSTRHVFWEVNHDEKGKSLGNGQILETDKSLETKKGYVKKY